MKKKIFTSLGLMSGTSMDGVDLSLIKTDGETEFTSILDDYFEFDKKLQEKLINLRESIFTINDLQNSSKKLDEVEKEFTFFNAKIIDDVIKNYEDNIDLIGFHGQTVFHDPNIKFTKQIGDGNLLSQITKKIVINNFREQDLKNDGQGAPLTPIFHRLIFKLLQKKNKINTPLNIINIGGITNITKILNDTNSIEKSMRALDIAPGNCMIDEWVRKNSKKQFDKDGNLAKSGRVNDQILNQAIDNFQILKFQKSLDIKDFDISFVKGLSLEDGCATITKFSAYLIAKGIEYMTNSNSPSSIKNLVCGGGRKNVFLIKSIEDNLKNINTKLENIDSYGFDGDFIESQAFAYLSVRTFINLPISFPNTTNCKTPTIGGTINKNF